LKASSTICTLGLTAICAAFFLTPAFADAETTSLCRGDAETSYCPISQVATHVHFVDGFLERDKDEKETELFFPGSTFLEPEVWGDVECYTLFLGDILNSGLGNPLTVHGQFYFFNCNEGNCLVQEINGPAYAELLKTASELAISSFEVEISVKCEAFPWFNICVYNGEGLQGHVTGGLSSGSEPGPAHIAFAEQEMHRVSGFVCPKTLQLDALFKSLEPLYIRS